MDIRRGNTIVGSIAAADPPSLTMSRGFDEVTINVELKRRLEPGKEKTTMVAGISADLTGDTKSQEFGAIGHGWVNGFCVSASNALDTPMTIPIRCSPRALAEYERRREGGPVKLRCHIAGMSYELVPVGGSALGAMADPHQFYGCVEIGIAKEMWTAALRACRLSASVLVEIPFPLADESRLDEELQALIDAFEAFEHGGTTAWKDTIGHIRPYLEKWKKAEPLPGTEPKDGSIRDRQWKLLNARDAVYKCCHYWTHEAKGACNQADALFALTTFASLLKAYRS